MSRTPPEWIGKTDDTPIPPRVRLRVFRAHGGVCHITGRKIGPGEPWECDHITALIEGGENRESNLAPALAEKHREKTAGEVKRKAKVDRVAKAHAGIKTKSKRRIPYRKFDGTPVWPGRD